MQFTFNEGHIQLPSQWQDQSMQVLVSTDNELRPRSWTTYAA